MSLDLKKLSDPEYRKEYNERKEREEKEWMTFLLDALKSPRLTAFESNFIRSLSRHDNIQSWDELSVKQMKVAKEIEKKIYAVG